MEMLKKSPDISFSVSKVSVRVRIMYSNCIRVGIGVRAGLGD